MVQIRVTRRSALRASREADLSIVSSRGLPRAGRRPLFLRLPVALRTSIIPPQSPLFQKGGSLSLFGSCVTLIPPVLNQAGILCAVLTFLLLSQATAENLSRIEDVTVVPDTPANDVPAVVKVIRREVTKRNTDPGGWPLPVVSHWANGFKRPTFSSDYQIGLLESGHHIVPTLPFPRPGAERYPEEGKTWVKKLARWKAPIALRAGQSWSPERYAGFVQYGLWLLRPRVIREFRGSTVPRAEFSQDFEALVAAVDRVWEDPILKRFWRRSTLVPNRARRHPYQSRIPDQWNGVDRWFMLSTSLDPKGSWKLDTEIPVFSLARATGEGTRRQWLLYAHAPAEPRKDVRLEIPGFGWITVDVTPGGSFYLVKAVDRSVTPVAR